MHEIKRLTLDFQKWTPVVVFNNPIKRKNGVQTLAITIPNNLKEGSADILVIPKTD